MVIGVQQEINRGATNSLWAERNVTATGMQRNHYGDATKRLLECTETTMGMQRNGYWNATEPLWGSNEMAIGAQLDNYRNSGNITRFTDPSV